MRSAEVDERLCAESGGDGEQRDRVASELVDVVAEEAFGAAPVAVLGGLDDLDVLSFPAGGAAGVARPRVGGVASECCQVGRGHGEAGVAAESIAQLIDRGSAGGADVPHGEQVRDERVRCCDERGFMRSATMAVGSRPVERRLPAVCVGRHDVGSG